MTRARYIRTHAWSGIKYESRTIPTDQPPLWTRLTIGWWTIECLPSSAASRVEKVLDFLWGTGDPPAAGQP